MKSKQLFIIGAVLVSVGLLFLFVAHKNTPQGSLVSISTAEAPWPTEIAHLRERLAAISLPALSAEGTALHIHQHLDIFVHGKMVEVPSGIGVQEGPGGYIAPIHAHDTTGIIHVESPVVEKFFLGQFFDIWGVRLSTTCIGGYCADGENTLTVYVNGAKYEGDPRALELTTHEEIVIVYGTKGEELKTVPSTYAFPEGY